MDLTYDEAGATRPDDREWRGRPAGFRAFETSVLLGHGEDLWSAASAALMTWGVKTRSGFRVRAEDGGTVDVRGARDFTVTARFGPLTIREPVRVVAVVDTPDRCGFAYGTRTGHPVSGEEAFVVARDADGGVRLTLRSLTRAAPGRWRFAFPLILLAQRWYRSRYLRALRP